jgi:hypothetical protein
MGMSSASLDLLDHDHHQEHGEDGSQGSSVETGRSSGQVAA